MWGGGKEGQHVIHELREEQVAVMLNKGRRTHMGEERGNRKRTRRR